MSRNYRLPLSRCPSCLASRNGPGPCACGWGTQVPKYGPERWRVSAGAPGPTLRAKDGVHADTSRVLDHELGPETFEDGGSGE